MKSRFLRRALVAAMLTFTVGVQTLAHATAAEPTSDIIARVGDQTITFGEVNTLLNSSAVVGVSIPALGTPERDTVRIAILDKMISANLLYLDALQQGLDRDRNYRRQLQRFADGILADRYLRQQVGDISVTEAEIQDFHRNQVVPGTELTAAARTQIEATLRKRKLEARKAALREDLRQGIDVLVYEKNIYIEGDERRRDEVPVARVGTETLTWGEVKHQLIAAGTGATRRDPLAMENEARRGALQAQIDLRILAQRARAAGLEADPVYQARFNEYRKTRLINLHRANLASQFEPTDAQLQAYYAEHRGRLLQPEARKVQEVVLVTREEAEDIKAQLERGDLTMWQAASRHSIAPGATQNLGEIGWVNRDRPLPALNEVIFALAPDAIGGPVQSPVGWHLVRVMDVRPAQFDDVNEPATRQRARRAYLHARLDDYVVNLRKNVFAVTVYEDTLIRLAQQEADMVKQLAERARDPDSVTQQRIKDYEKLMTR